MAKKVKLGRPPHVPDDTIRNKVRIYSACNMKQKDIWPLLGICEDTFRKYYLEDYEAGTDITTGMVGEKLLARALGDGPDAERAAEFFLKTRGGWTDKKSVEITGKDGAPLIPTQEINVKSMEPDAIQALKFALEKAQAKALAVDMDYVEGEAND